MTQGKAHLNHSHSLDSYVESLRKANLRVTEPRLAIIQALLKKHGPFTVEEIQGNITQEACDLATIYRTLASLEKAALVKRCDFGDGSARYELKGQEDHHHHHVICKGCKKVEVLDDCELEAIDSFAQKRGFTEITHSLEFFGICPSCRR